MKIPEKVLIGGLWYTVERVEGTFLDGITACDGIHSYSEQLIKVVKSGSEHYQNIVFLHEVLHAVLEAYIPSENKEDIAEQLSKGLYQLIQDNPQMFKSE